jgi:tetratricopeptide (TPR) repeat protein
LHLLLGNLKAYQQLCKRMPAEVEQSTDAQVAYDAARPCTVSPEGPINPAQAVNWAERAVAVGRQASNLHMLGRAHYRAGQFDEAVRRCEESLKIQPNWPGRILNWLVLAMAHQRLNHPDDARQWLAQAVQWRDNLPKRNHKTPIAPGSLYRAEWLEFNVLYPEARALLEAAAQMK